MKLWAVFNGYRGAGHVAVLVEADSEQQARRKAADKLREAAGSGGASRYTPDEYSRVTHAEHIELPAVVELA